jgi:hypothetical protein
MQFLKAVAAAALVVAASGSDASAQTAYTCGIGTFQSAREIDGSFEIRVQLGLMLYTVTAPAGLAWNADPTHFVPDSIVDVCASAAEVIVDTRDGKDFRGALARSASVAVTAGATAPAARPSTGAATDRLPSR